MVTIISPSGYASANGWVMLTNVWNSGGLVFGTDYSISADYDPANLTNNTTFSWSFPQNALSWSQVRAYPDVMFGSSPWGRGQSDPTHVFPIQVSGISSLTASYNLNISGQTSGFDVAYDIFFTSNPNGDTSKISNELMIWLHKGNLDAYGQAIGKYIDGSFSATIYHTGTYTAIVADKDTLAGNVNIAKMTHTLEGLGILSPKEYLASVQLGAEIVGGIGSLTINQTGLNVVDAEPNKIVATQVTGSTAKTAGTLSYTPGEAQVVDSHGQTIGFKSTGIDDSGTVSTQYFDNNSNFTGSDIQRIDASGTVLTQHFNYSWSFLGADSKSTEADNTSLTQYFDSTWRFTGADSTTINSDNTSTTQYFDSGWHFTGADSVSGDNNGTILTQHFNSSRNFSGADSDLHQSDGSEMIQHFDKGWNFTGAQVVEKAVGATYLKESFDSRWVFTGAQLFALGGSTVVPVHIYDSAWHIIS